MNLSNINLTVTKEQRFLYQIILILVVTMVLSRQDASARFNYDVPIEKIWITAADWEQRRQAIFSSPLIEMREQAEGVLHTTRHVEEVITFEDRMNAQKRLEALVVLTALDKDRETAREAGAICLAYLQHETSDLGKASLALNAVVAYAFTRQHWTEETRLQVEQRLFELGKSFETIGRGNPDNPFNNWWGVTHSGAGLCFLAVKDSYDGAREYLEQELRHIASYLQQYGTLGHYYEGTGYGLYAMANWGPFLNAAEQTLKGDLANLNPGIRQFGELIYSMTTTDKSPDQPEGSKRLGRRIAWNDDGSGFPEASIASLFFPLANKEDRPRLKTAYDKLCGSEGDLSYTRMSQTHGHAMWTLLYYPLEESELQYTEAFENFYYDKRLGLAVFRNQFQDAKDCVLGIYAKAYHGGGHTQQDAGSFRFMGLGSSWAHFGGQAKPAAIYQNVLLKNGTQLIKEDRYQNQTGKVVYLSQHNHGGSLSVDLGGIYKSPRVRRHFSVHYNALPDVEAIIGIWDEIIDQEPSEWAWSLCFENKLELIHDGDLAVFDIIDSYSGASMQVAFGGVSDIELQNFTGPPSNRRFSNGQEREYPGARYITASKTTGRLNLLTILTLQKNKAPSIEFSGSGPDLHATIDGQIKVSLNHSKWFMGPLEIEVVSTNN